MVLSAIKSIIRFWYHVIIEAPNKSVVKMTCMDDLDLKTTVVKRIENFLI